jgi:hypothetical protein
MEKNESSWSFYSFNNIYFINIISFVKIKKLFIKILKNEYKEVYEEYYIKFNNLQKSKSKVIITLTGIIENLDKYNKIFLKYYNMV